MNTIEIKKIVVETSSNLYLRQPITEDSFVEEALREDGEEVEACKKIVREALTIPTYYMNCTYGYTKAINTILKEIENKLGTENQDRIVTHTESTIAALNKARENNKEFFGIDEDTKVDSIYKAIREDLEAYNYDSAYDLCNNVYTILDTYKTKIHEAIDNTLDKTVNITETYKALKDAGISESVEHSLDHLIGEFKLFMEETAIKDINYISELCLTKSENLIENPIEESDIEKDNIVSIFGENFYDGKE